MDIYKVIGGNIRSRRQALGLPMEKMGEYLSVSYQQVQKYEKGINRLPTHMLVEMATIFRCSTDELCGLSPVPYPKESEEVVLRFSRVSSPELRKSLLNLMSAAAVSEAGKTPPE